MFAAMGLLLAGCADVETPTKAVSVIAVVEDGQTRTSVTDEGTFTWSAGDQVWLQTANGNVLGTLYANGLSISEINLVENAMLSMFSFTDNLLLTSIQVSSDFSMDNCLFTSVGNNGVLSIVNTKGESFYYVGQYLTVCADGVVYKITNGGKNAQLISMEETSASWSGYQA